MICQKTVTLTVESSVAAWWWPLEEASGNRIDASQGIALIPNATGSHTIDNTTGVVALGCRINKAAGGFSSPGLISAIDTSFTYAGEAITIAGWARRISGSIVNHALFGMIRFLDDAVGTTELAAVGFSDLASTFEMFHSTQTSFNTIDAAHIVPLGTWFFFRIYYDPVAAEIGFQIDNGVVVTGPVTGVFPNSGFGEVSFTFGTQNPAAVGEFDECAIYFAKLTDAQASYIYNASNGRTWPVSLP